MNEKYNLMTAWEAFVKWKMYILGVVLVAGIGSYIATLFTDPVYESSATIYATNPSITDRTYLAEKNDGQMPVYHFGGKDDIDRLVAICESRQVLAYIVEKFDLINYYKVSGRSDEAKFIKALEKLESKIKVLKDENRGVEITVKDRNKYYAANITNEIISEADKVVKRMILGQRTESKKLFDRKIRKKEAQIKDFLDSLNNVSSLLLKNPASPFLKTKYELLDFELKSNLQSLEDLREIYDHFEIATNDNLSFIYVMQKAYPPEKPLPIDILIVGSSILLAIFISTLLAVIIEVSKAS